MQNRNSRGLKKNFSWSVIIGSLHDLTIIDDKVGENMKQLELSAEKAVEREEKLKDKILSIQQKFKSAEGR